MSGLIKGKYLNGLSFKAEMKKGKVGSQSYISWLGEVRISVLFDLNL
jgi:hypothetical protein